MYDFKCAHSPELAFDVWGAFRGSSIQTAKVAEEFSSLWLNFRLGSDLF